RRAAVSSFGMSGTNAHVILEQGDPDPIQSNDSDQASLFVISGHTERALRAQASRLLDSIRGREDLNMADVAWSLATTRTAHSRRAVITGNRSGLEEGLAALASDVPSPNVFEYVAGSARDVVFVFPGQGAQWVGMAVELLG
ncbi:hypothetical protein B2J88_52535, partial [Rhodococcus sp. SRB_17]|nr:hypothetical protein [Rhodococcus sp. SRB_17]